MDTEGGDIGYIKEGYLVSDGDIGYRGVRVMLITKGRYLIGYRGGYW